MAPSHVPQARDDHDPTWQPFTANTHRQNPLSNSWASPQKRQRSSITLSRQENSQDELGGNIRTELDESTEHALKRSRVAGWPFKDSADASTDEARISRVQPLMRPVSPRQSSRRSRSKRPSKFIEGSMNDRASNRPPSPYIGEEQAMDQYEADREGHRTSEDTDTFYDAGIEPPKASGMYRFGKALVTAFNPAVVWQGLNGMWKEKHEGQVDPQKAVMQERQMKAEKAYAELKKSGFRGTQGVADLRPSVDVPFIKYEEDEASRPAPHRDSGVEMDGYRSSNERKRDETIVESGEPLMPPPPIPRFGRSASPLSDASSSRISSVHLRKPSFSSLKKVKSHLQLPSQRRHSASPAPIPSIESDIPTTESAENVMRKQPSRKDLQKQQKLSKKVSDLEGKLEMARRDLQQAMEEGPPVPRLPSKVGVRQFKPGALASLPSERILNSQNPSEQDDSKSKVKTKPAMPAGSAAATAAIERALGIHQASVEIEPKKQSPAQLPSAGPSKRTTVSISKTAVTKKRKSGGYTADDQRYKPESDGDNDDEWEAVTKTAPKNKAGKARKSQKLEKSGSPNSKKLKNEDEPPKTPAKSPATNAVPALPRSVVSEGFDLSKVDKAKILAMRSNPNSTVPFGILSDDITNLRKEYAEMTNDQLIKYIAALLAEAEQPARARKQTALLDHAAEATKATDHTAISHHDRHAPPFLGPPRLVSPSKLAANRSQLTSPRPSLDYSQKAESKVHTPSFGVRDAVTASPVKDGSVPAVPEIPRELEGDRSKILAEAGKKQGLVAVQEKFEWPDDVF
ncbi:hypothetical protein MMC24_006457 [Lignoscripta atroalba]|nr:hypothetical protein [Lignoscripta atroalba]